VKFTTQFPDAPYVTRCRTVGLRNTGACLSPFNAFLHLQGLETLSVRLERLEANARTVAAYLAGDPRVAWVSFLGFPYNPYYQLARRYLGEHVPSIITFGVHGGRDAGIAVFNRVDLFKRLVNMGDAKSLIAHPASTTHRQLTPEDLELVGITPDMVRLSIGLEHTDDLIEDLDQALASR
jgi:O-acetylhomoserine (thiol)-lyase